MNLLVWNQRTVQAFVSALILLVVSGATGQEKHTSEIPSSKRDPNAIEQWVNKSGKTMDARLLTFDQESKQVKFVKSDGVTYAFPLVDLTLRSKISALTHPNFDADSASFENWFGIAKLLGLLCLIYIIGSFIAGIAGFFLSANLVMGRRGFSIHLSAFVKLFLIQLIYILVITIGQGCAFVFVQSNPDLAFALSQIVTGLIGLIFLFVILFSLAGHYDASLIRSFGLILVQGLITNLTLALILGCIGFLVYLGYQSDSELLDGILVEWILRPFELV